MATKKKAAKKKKGGGRKFVLPDDPPILVGGGGSSYIWVNLGQGQTPVSPNGFPADAPTPRTPGSYSVSRISNSPVRLYFNDGRTPGPPGEVPLTVANSRTWYIRFAPPGPPPPRRKAAKK